MARKTSLPTLGKAESITVRLDPKIRYGLELLARKQRRNLSSVVEWALQTAIYDTKNGLYDEQSGEKLNFLDFLWDVEESDRLYQLVTCRPNLLTFEEEKLIKVIIESDYLAYLREKHQDLMGDDPLLPSRAFQQKIKEGLREHFDTYKQVAHGHLGKEALPKPPRGWKLKATKEAVA